MAYRLNEVTIRTDNSIEGMKRIEELWCDVSSGRLAILFDSDHNFQLGISPISRYSNYESDHTGKYDLSILGVSSDFFSEIEIKVGAGFYKKYDVSDADGDLGICSKKAWEIVWDEQSKGLIRRNFSVDFESTVPSEYAKDGKAHCYLYIAIEQ